MNLVPAIDIIKGQCVRLSQGDYSQKKVYDKSPLAVALQFQNAGAKYLHVVDLDGAKQGKPANAKVIESICKSTQLKVDVGGGIKTLDQATALFKVGVDQINVGSMAVKSPELLVELLKQFGGEKIILSADVLNEEVKINGWQSGSGINLFSLIDKFIPNGLQFVTVTDISKDGMLAGPATELYKQLLAKYSSLKVTASGGVSSFQYLETLCKTGVYSCIIGKAFYENRISLSVLNDFKC